MFIWQWLEAMLNTPVREVPLFGILVIVVFYVVLCLVADLLNAVFKKIWRRN